MPGGSKYLLRRDDWSPRDRYIVDRIVARVPIQGIYFSISVSIYLGVYVLAIDPSKTHLKGDNSLASQVVGDGSIWQQNRVISL